MIQPKKAKVAPRHQSKQQDREESVEEGCFEFRPWALPDIDVSIEEIDEYLDRYPM
jgi:hypothetical protein